jgi:hypothetical protein
VRARVHACMLCTALAAKVMTIMTMAITMSMAKTAGLIVGMTIIVTRITITTDMIITSMAKTVAPIVVMIMVA